MTPDQSRVIVGGAFQNVNGSPANGLGRGRRQQRRAAALGREPGRPRRRRQRGHSEPVHRRHRDLLDRLRLRPTATSRASCPPTRTAATINWLADCHGDTYGTFSTNGMVYVVSHMHYCANIGGFPDTNPRTVWHRATAFTTQVTGTVATNGERRRLRRLRRPAQPVADQLVPDMDIGTYTGQSQAAGRSPATSKYVVYGGEFPKVNGVAQQGLVRFAVPALAPKQQGPRVSAGDFAAQRHTADRHLGPRHLADQLGPRRPEPHLRGQRATALPVYTITTRRSPGTGP